MERSIVEKWQNLAIGEFKQATSDETQTAWMQATMLAEIALQLAKLNEHLEKITERGGYLDFIGDQLKDMAKDMSAVQLSDLG